MFTNEIVIDGRAHLMGRLASIVAKEILSGQKVVVVRAEMIDISGAIWRNSWDYKRFIKKRTNTNPKRGPLHYHSPAKMFWRVVRGMVPHKTVKGNEAMLRMKVFEGIPQPYDTQKRLVVPEALKPLRLKSNRRYTNLGDLAERFGWNHRETVTMLEEKRKAKSQVFYEAKQKREELKGQAKQQAMEKLQPALKAALEEFGFN